jgi:RNA polymerase sigma-70 factor (ECF subfamily)
MGGTKTRDQALDAFLVASARLGDRRRFGLLVERWDPKLRAHAWRLLGDAEQARDVVQESWADIVRGLRRLQDEAAFPAWAYRIVSRRCADLIGSAIRQRALADALAREPGTVESEDWAEGDKQRVRSAIASLPPEQKSAIALFYIEEMSVAEVAVALDVPMGTVKTRLMHARRKLRAALEGEDQCVTSTN